MWKSCDEYEVREDREDAAKDEVVVCDDVVKLCDVLESKGGLRVLKVREWRRVGRKTPDPGFTQAAMRGFCLHPEVSRARHATLPMRQQNVRDRVYY